MANGVSGTKGSGSAGGTAANSKAPVAAKSALDEPVNSLKPIGEVDPSNYMYNDTKQKQWILDNAEYNAKSINDKSIDNAHTAVYKFTGSNSGSIRAAQKKGDKTSEAGKRGVWLEEYVEKAPQWDNSHDLHRGMTLSQSAVKDIINGQKSGKVIDINNSGTASWSTKYSVSEGFASSWGNEVPVIFRTKKMRKATPVAHLSQHPSEHEVLSSATNRFKAVSIKKKNINGKSGYLIDVEQVE